MLQVTHGRKETSPVDVKQLKSLLSVVKSHFNGKLWLCVNKPVCVGDALEGLRGAQ